jgi:antitoxin MazE
MDPIKSKLIKIGNSQGIRIPKFIVDLLNLNEEIELIVDEEAKELHIRHKKQPRDNWDKSFKHMHKKKDDALLIDDVLEGDFDEEW